VQAAVEKELQRIQVFGLIRRGDRVGITMGSRGMANLRETVGALVETVQKAGGKPFVVPGMGSHGGGTADGQLKILQSLGIEEQSLGVPVRACAESEMIGTTASGVPVHVSTAVVNDLDKLILFNRVKSHTEFNGSIESGIHKMAAVGLGNPRGAKTVHEYALDMGYEAAIVETGRFVMDTLPVVCAVATVENYYHETAQVRAMLIEGVPVEERDLLRMAKAGNGRIPFDRLDLLIVDEIGKDVSGAGMDTGVIGRIMVYGQAEPLKPDIKRIAVLDLTEASHGNAIGIGLADFAAGRVLHKMDRAATYLNCITAQTPEKARIPTSFPTDREVIEAALLSIGPVKTKNARVVHIRNTELVKVMEISESLVAEADSRKDLDIVEPPKPMQFDEAGSLERVPADL
jgi:hypothetical protein